MSDVFVKRVEQSVYTFICGVFNFYGQFSNGSYAESHKMNIYFRYVFFQLQQNLINIFFICQNDQNFQFFGFNEQRVRILAEEKL